MTLHRGTGLANICPCWLDVTYQPRSSVCVTRTSFGLIINAGMRLASSRRLIFGGPVIALGLTGRSFSAVKLELIKPTRRPSVSLVTETGRFLWMSRHLKWWSSLKSAVFDSSLSLPPLVSEGGGLVCDSVGKADQLSDHFDSKQSRKAVDLPLTCHPAPSLTNFAFRSSEVSRLLLDLDPYGGTDPFCLF